MSEFRRKKNVLHQLVKARDATRHKCNLLKLSKDNVKRVLGEPFRPIVEPLEKLVAKQSKGAVSRAVTHDKKYTKSIKRDEEHDDIQDDTLQAAETSFESATSNDGDNESNKNTKYLEMLSQDRYLDKIYGIRKENGQFMIGNSPIDFEGSFIDVNGAKYATTDGILELLITKQPTESQIINSDMENYRKILEASSAHKRRYNSNEKIRPHNSNKFKYIIAPMFEKQGAGVLRRYKLARMNMSMDYVYWG